MIGVMLTFSLYLQLGEGFSAIGTGVAMIPLCLGVAIGAGIGNAVLGPKFGRPTLHVGIAVHGARHRRPDPDAQPRRERLGARRPGAARPASALGAALSPLFDFVLAGVEDDEVGSASGVLNAMQQLGGSIGIAVLGTIFFSVAAGGALDDAFHTTLWVELGLLVVTAVLVARCRCTPVRAITPRGRPARPVRSRGMPPRDDEVQALVEQLSAELDRSVLVDDASLRLLAYSPTLGSEDEVRRTAILTRETPARHPRPALRAGDRHRDRARAHARRARTSGSSRACASRSAARARCSATCG